MHHRLCSETLAQLAFPEEKQPEFPMLKKMERLRSRAQSESGGLVYGIFNVRTDVNACDSARGCTDTVRESALKVGSGRKIPCRTRESNLPQRRAGPTI